jgi:hypothetical protein
LAGSVRHPPTTTSKTLSSRETAIILYEIIAFKEKAEYCTKEHIAIDRIVEVNIRNLSQRIVGAFTSKSVISS